MGVSLLRRNPEGEGKGEGVEERERGEPEAALGETEAVAPLVHQAAVRPAGEAAWGGGPVLGRCGAGAVQVADA
jgi:hypothetical protein